MGCSVTAEPARPAFLKLSVSCPQPSQQSVLFFQHPPSQTSQAYFGCSQISLRSPCLSLHSLQKRKKRIEKENIFLMSDVWMEVYRSVSDCSVVASLEPGQECAFSHSVFFVCLGPCYAARLALILLPLSGLSPSYPFPRSHIVRTFCGPQPKQRKGQTVSIERARPCFRTLGPSISDPSPSGRMEVAEGLHDMTPTEDAWKRRQRAGPRQDSELGGGRITWELQADHFSDPH